MRKRIAIGVVLTLAAACGGGTGDDVEPLDAPAAIDAAAVDARVDAATVIDAPTIDAGTGIDAAPGSIADLCARACGHIAACSGEAEGADCQQGCNPDLVDCTPAELETIDQCTTVACPNGPDPVFECLTGVTCIDG